MSWWPWSLEESVHTLEKSVAAIWVRLEQISEEVKGTDMSKLHDRLEALTTELAQSADNVVENTVTETEFDDVISQLEAVIKKLKDKLSGGGFTPSGN